jgi:hypothetical protein
LVLKARRRGEVSVPEPLWREIVDAYARVERVMATLEEPGVLEALEESRRMLAGGEYVECSIDEVDKVLK